MLVWDAYKCHLTDGVKNVVNKVANSDVSVIPGGLTGHVQPADICWNKPFKAKYKELYALWTAEGKKTYTCAGNIHAPSKLQCLEEVGVEVVKKSCGISVKVDGSEDKHIHCIKDGGIAPEARAEIEKSTAAILAPPEDAEDDDPDQFKDIEEDEEETDQNEVVLEDDGTDD